MATLEDYVAAFATRCDELRVPEDRRIAGPGVDGALSPRTGRLTMLVRDDRGYETLAELLPGARVGVITVCGEARRSMRLLEADGAWTGSPLTAMARQDLGTVPVPALPSGLAMRAVRRTAADPLGGVELEEAVAAALAADPDDDQSPETLAGHLRRMPGTARLLAAVDNEGTVRATAGARTLGADATVIFVNTDHGWRRQGVGTAMTAAAIRAAHDLGATRACLNASRAGRSIYARLGFTAVAATTQFVRAGGEL